ncbi:hypothetical protein LSAT2_012094 [Lamellibrachia satsuma]|nr:hypothetical protein LSAT2_012094 [Lamellibrachia satsuma]
MQVALTMRTSSCEEYEYGGCSDNLNRFPSEMSCQATCRVKKPRCRPLNCMFYCQNGFKRNQYGCLICACLLPQTGHAKP